MFEYGLHVCSCSALLRAEVARPSVTRPNKPCFARVTGRTKAVAAAEAQLPTRLTHGDPKQQLQLALKEWAVTCAALGQGDQTVCTELAFALHAGYLFAWLTRIVPPDA